MVYTVDKKAQHLTVRTRGSISHLLYKTQRCYSFEDRHTVPSHTPFKF